MNQLTTRCWQHIAAASKSSCRFSKSPGVTRLLTNKEQYSTDVNKPSNCHVSIDDNIAVLQMRKTPVNSLNLEFLTELDKTIENLENNPKVKGLIITSLAPKIFCAGVDILELYKPRKERSIEFWKSMQNFWMRLYGSHLTTVAAINGHSPAGGCLIALSCDYRIMASGKYTIGLNETSLGITAPFWFVASMTNVIGHRQTEKAVQLGSLFTPEDALKVGLVDELADETVILENAKREMTKWLSVPHDARQMSKEILRRPTVEKLAVRRDQDVDNFVKIINRDSVQKTLGSYLESLKKKK